MYSLVEHRTNNLGTLPPRRTLCKIAEDNGGRLPPIVFLQVDNCSRENKNGLVFAYLTWLVEVRFLGVTKIQLGFLMVG
jgi:hypothetical protein